MVVWKPQICAVSSPELDGLSTHHLYSSSDWSPDFTQAY